MHSSVIQMSYFSLPYYHKFKYQA